MEQNNCKDYDKLLNELITRNYEVIKLLNEKTELLAELESLRKIKNTVIDISFRKEQLN